MQFSSLSWVRLLSVSLLLLSSTFAQTLTSIPKTEATPIPNFAGENSSEPNLVCGANGQVYLSWIQRRGKTASLCFSRWLGEAWSPAQTIASGDDWFINWADFPSMEALTDGTLAAQWLQKSAADTYAYDVKISLSRDAGKTWSKAISPHKDGTPTEHGFVSLIALNSDHFGIFWLDGREMVAKGDKKPGSMALRFATLSREGVLSESIVIDDQVCECCQTKAIALGGDEAMVVYRDKSDKQVRDISIAKVAAGKVSKAVRFPDNWVIPGCPVNGPAIHRRGDRIALSWFTVDGEKSKVLARSSSDGGKTFGAQMRIDNGDPMGRVDTANIHENLAIVTWIEKVGDHAEIRYRWLSKNDKFTASSKVATTTANRSAGFPRIAVVGLHVLVAWTDTQQKKIRTAIIGIPFELK